MAQNVNLTFINDQDFFLAIDVSRLAVFYDLTTGVWRMHARTTPGAPVVTYAWSSASGPNGDGYPGDITYNAGAQLLLITAPYSDMRRIAPATYAYGLKYELDVPVTQFLMEDIWVGSLIIQQGCVFT